MKLLKVLSALGFFVFLVVIYQNIMAFRDGVVGFTKKNGNEVGCVCHEFKPNDSVSVRFVGPTQVHPNDTAIFKLQIANGPAIAGGCDIAASRGDVILSSLDTSLRRAESFPGSGFELTHRYPKLFIGDTLTFTFKYVAPSTPNITDTLFANGNSVNDDSTSENDKWDYAPNFVISVTPSAIANNNSLAGSFQLSQNYPNPFNPETKISFIINKSSNISLEIFDSRGSVVAHLIDNKFYTPGNYSVAFNAGQYNLSSGVYFYRLSAGNFSEVKRMMLVK